MKTFKFVLLLCFEFIFCTINGNLSAKEILNKSDIVKQNFWHDCKEKFNVSDFKTAYIYPNEMHLNKRNKYTFAGIKIQQCILTLNEKKIERIYILFDYACNADDLFRLSNSVDKLKSELHKTFNSFPQQEELTFNNLTNINCLVFKNELTCTQLFSKLNMPGGFVSLVITPTTSRFADVSQLFKLTKFRVPVLLNAQGDKYLSVPMHHQLPGMGSCWNSTIARQLHALGGFFDQQIVLAIAKGREQEAMTKLGQYIEFEYQTKKWQKPSVVSKQCIKFIKDYNFIANQTKQAKIKYKKEENKIVWSENMDIMNSKIIKKIKLDKTQKKLVKSFRKYVFNKIDEGIPVGWTIKRHSGKGKHRRMIVGYNRNKDEIFYSDSWGCEKKLKSTSVTAGALMTVWMQFIIPRNIYVKNDNEQ